MRILFVINNFFLPGNGICSSAQRTVKALRDAGQDVRVLAGPNKLNPDGPQADFPLKEFHFPVFQPIIEAEGFSYAKGDLKIIEEAIRWADVVHLHEMFVLQYKAIKIAKRLGKPIVATFHMFPENILSSLGMGKWRWMNRTLLKLWREHIYNECEYVQCPTEKVLDRLRRYHFKANLVVISNGIVPDSCIRPATPPANYQDPKRPLNVVCISRFAVEKDQPTLIEAMHYSKFAKRIQLHFCGSGPEEKKYKRLARKIYEQGIVGYEPIFSFNTRQELREIAADADLCIHCAKLEVEGLSIMEAMQQGAVPVISEGPYIGTSQFALNKHSVFPAQNPEALAHRIDYWLDHPDERWELGKKYVELMETYDIKHSAEKLTQMYRNAVDSKKGL